MIEDPNINQLPIGEQPVTPDTVPATPPEGAGGYQSNNRRIAKNTLLLYLRMIIVMLVTLYTSRLVLAALFGVGHLSCCDGWNVHNLIGFAICLDESFLDICLGHKGFQST